MVQCATSVPTVPTPIEPVGTGQGIDKKHCSDRSDCSDRTGGVKGQKRKSLSGLVSRLRQSRGQSSTFETRHVHTPASEPITSPIPPSLEVETVGTVGTANELGVFEGVEWSEQWSERSEQPPPVMEADWKALEAFRHREDGSPDAWGPAEAERCQGLPPLGSDENPIAWGVPQSIPHDVMVAGLLAASRIRAPAAPVIKSHGAKNADPWAAGVADLQRMTPLDGFTSMQWTQTGIDAAELLRTYGTDMHRLGWDAADAFGLHPDVLGRAVRAWGLALLLDGGRVVEITAAGATIERPNGVRQSFTRRSGNGAVPAWEIQL